MSSDPFADVPDKFPDEMAEDMLPRWDADDERRQRDTMAPPQVPCECGCIECGRTFMSDLMWFQRVLNDPEGFAGFWMCPTPNCGGAGFTFDIFPTDPGHPANAGWTFCDDDEEAWAEAFEHENPPEREYDPAEPGYKLLDELFGDADDDLEGEEWKLGLQPGERPEQLCEPSPEQLAAWDEYEARYDQPDERPREVDGSNFRRPTESDRRPPGSEGGLEEDDIPF